MLLKINTQSHSADSAGLLSQKQKKSRQLKTGRKGVARYLFRHSNGTELRATAKDAAKSLGVYESAIGDLILRGTPNRPWSKLGEWSFVRRIDDEKQHATFEWLSKQYVKGFAGTRAGGTLGPVWDKSNLIIAMYRSGMGSVKIVRKLWPDNPARKTKVGALLRDVGVIISGREKHTPRTADPAARMTRNFRSRLYAHESPLAPLPIESICGCSMPNLMAYIESKFLPGMSWDNYGFYGWHVDHETPCARFDLTDPSEAARCFHFSNLRPLWALDNMRKGPRAA